MEFLLTMLSNVGEYLLPVWNWLTFNVDNPLALTVIVFVEGYLGARGAPVLWLLRKAVKYFKDGKLTDTEAAALLWTLVALITDWLPFVSKDKILTYTPLYWHPVILEGKEPAFELVAVPTGKVAQVRGLLSSGG